MDKQTITRSKLRAVRLGMTPNRFSVVAVQTAMRDLEEATVKLREAETWAAAIGAVIEAYEATALAVAGTGVEPQAIMGALTMSSANGTELASVIETALRFTGAPAEYNKGDLHGLPMQPETPST